MRTQEETKAPEARQVNVAWADRLARRRSMQLHGHALHTADLVPQAIAALWAPFDEALEQANAALEQAGLADRIIAERNGTECRYSAVGLDGSQRSIAVYLSLPVLDEHMLGGAYIGTSETRLSIYLVPFVNGEEVRWLVASSGTPFTAALIHDLFLSVFADDPAATGRISPLSGNDIFQSPWS